MNNIFREESIKVNGEYKILKKKSFEEIFEYNRPPFMCVGASGAGKTTIAIDIIFKFSKKASRIYYISATESSVGESGINAIPKLYRRSPSIEDLDSVWKEIKKTSEQSKVPPEKLLELIGKLYPRQDTNIINIELKNYERELKKELEDKYTDLPEMEKKQNIIDDIEVTKIEILTRLILNGIEQYGSTPLSLDDINIVSNLVSTEQKTILILDDISSELTMLKTSKRKYSFNDNLMSSADAYRSILTDILTKARHYNCICVIFIHGWNIIDLKSLTTNFIILDQTASSNMRMLRSISETATKSAQAASDLVFSKYKYHFVVVKNGGEDVCVGKADLHIGETIELCKLNRNLLKAYNEVINNTDLNNIDLGSISPVLNEDNNDEDKQQAKQDEDSSYSGLDINDV